MNKRSAMLVAAGLVLALIVGGVAMSVGVTGPQASQAAPRAARRSARPPIIRTERRTVTVHRRALASSSATVQVPPGSASVSGASSIGSGDDQGGIVDREDESSDDGFEDRSDDHGGDEHEPGEDEGGGDADD